MHPKFPKFKILLKIGFAVLLSTSFVIAQESPLKETVEQPEKPPQTYFKTSIEAIEYYRLRLSNSNITKYREIYEYMGLYIPKEANQTVDEAEPKFKKFRDKAGKLIFIDALIAPKLGENIQRFGYILKYDNGMGFLDCWVFRSEQGWSVNTVSTKFGSDSDDVLQSIPGIFYIR